MRIEKAMTKIANDISITTVTEIHQINLNGQKIVGTHDQLEEVCLALEEFLYEEPSYDELNETILDLHIENEKLQKENQRLEKLNFIAGV